MNIHTFLIKVKLSKGGEWQTAICITDNADCGSDRITLLDPNTLKTLQFPADHPDVPYNIGSPMYYRGHGILIDADA